MKKILLCLTLVMILAGFGFASAHASSDVIFCTEADCSSITVTFGGQVHPNQLACGSNLGFTGVPAGIYSFLASGCGKQWSGSISVNGVNNYGIALCPPSGLACCPRGCDNGVFLCEECQGPPGPPCPVMTSMPSDEGAVALLRDFRDVTLSRSLEGIALTQLYYEHANELAGILLRSPVLARNLRQLILNNLYVLEQCMNGEAVAVDDADLAQADRLLAILQLKASPQLRKDLGTVRAELANGGLLQRLCP